VKGVAIIVQRVRPRTLRVRVIPFNGPMQAQDTEVTVSSNTSNIDARCIKYERILKLLLYQIQATSGAMSVGDKIVLGNLEI
jgi:hypothetical protein